MPLIDSPVQRSLPQGLPSNQRLDSGFYQPGRQCPRSNLAGFEFSTRSVFPYVFKEWAMETSICVLVIGPLALLLNIGQIYFQDEYVANLVSRFPAEDATKEDDTDVGNRECKDSNDVGSTQSETVGEQRDNIGV